MFETLKSPDSIQSCIRQILLKYLRIGRLISRLFISDQQTDSNFPKYLKSIIAWGTFSKTLSDALIEVSRTKLVKCC